jgi:hypothetical protein
MSQKRTTEDNTKQRKQHLPKLSGMKQQEQVITTQRWVNQETGEERVFTVIDRSQMGDYGFHKVWLEDLGRIIGLLGGGKVKVFNYVLNNLNPISNQFGGTIREVSELLGIDKVTVQSTFTILIKEGFMKRVRNGTYQVSARMLVKGNHEKRAGLMLTYDKLDSPSSEALFSSNNI